MYNSNLAVYAKEMAYYEDMSKFANLGLWIIQILGGQVDNIQDLIGEVPSLNSSVTKKELTEEDLEIISFCKENGLKYRFTNQGIKIG